MVIEFRQVPKIILFSLSVHLILRLNRDYMQIPIIFRLFLVVSALSAVSMFRPGIDPATDTTPKVSDQNMMAVLYHQQAAEYRALCYQAFNVAKWRLNEKVAYNTGKKPLAVIVDVDETVLDNSPYNARMVKKNETYTPESWSKWVGMRQAAAVPGAVDFLKFADSKEVGVFYITNRSQADKQSTLDNLRLLGFPQVEFNHVYCKLTDSNKEERREEIAKQYNIIMLCGDNMNDFSAQFEKQPTYHRNSVTDSIAPVFGDKYIVLPNPMYGDWENALYSYQHPTDSTKDAQRRKSLRIY